MLYFVVVTAVLTVVYLNKNQFYHFHFAQTSKCTTAVKSFSLHFCLQSLLGICMALTEAILKHVISPDFASRLFSFFFAYLGSIFEKRDSKWMISQEPERFGNKRPMIIQWLSLDMTFLRTLKIFSRVVNRFSSVKDTCQVSIKQRIPKVYGL